MYMSLICTKHFLFQLFMKRMKVATGSEKQALQQLDPSFMSDEEDGEGSQAGSWVVRSPPWRSPRLSFMLRGLQGGTDCQASSLSHPKNARVNGEPCARHPPSSPAWALATVDRPDHQRSPSPQPLSPPVWSPQSLPRQDTDEDDDNDSVFCDERSTTLDSPIARHRTRRIRPISY